MLKRMAVLVGVVVVLWSPGFAQDNIRLQFEIWKNDTVVATPQVSVADGGRGSLNIYEIAAVSFSAERTTNDRVSLHFDIRAGEKTIKPRLLLVQSQPGSVSWSQGEDSVVIRVSAR